MRCARYSRLVVAVLWSGARRRASAASLEHGVAEGENARQPTPFPATVLRCELGEPNRAYDRLGRKTVNGVAPTGNFTSAWFKDLDGDVFCVSAHSEDARRAAQVRNGH